MDLRERVLRAREAGEGSQRVLAARFGGSVGAVCTWLAAARDEGRRQAKPMRGGPKPTIRGEVEAAMLRLAGSPHHPRQAEIAARLAETTGVRVHLTTVHRALRRAGWT